MAVSAAIWLTALDEMPSAMAMAMPFSAAHVAVGNQRAVEVLVDLLAAPVRALPDRYRQFGGHVSDRGAQDARAGRPCSVRSRSVTRPGARDTEGCAARFGAVLKCVE